METRKLFKNSLKWAASQEDLFKTFAVNKDSHKPADSNSLIRSYVVFDDSGQKHTLKKGFLVMYLKWLSRFAVTYSSFEDNLTRLPGPVSQLMGCPSGSSYIPTGVLCPSWCLNRRQWIQTINIHWSEFYFFGEVGGDLFWFVWFMGLSRILQWYI